MTFSLKMLTSSNILVTFTALYFSAGCASKVVNEVVYNMSQPVPAQACFKKRPEERYLCLLEAKKRIPYEQYVKEREEIMKPKLNK